jgi:hypothetical protein
MPAHATERRAGKNGGMARTLEWQFDYPARYEVIARERIDRSGGKAAFSYPGGSVVPMWQELADGPIFEIRPAEGHPWVGVFGGGGYGHRAAAPGQLLGWPDEFSLCVVYAGGADVVRSDDPTQTYTVDTVWPITDVLSIPEHKLVVFADFTNAAAYGVEGHVWTSPRIALDELTFVRASGSVLFASGFFGGVGNVAIEIDVRTGRPVRPLPLDLSD